MALTWLRIRRRVSMTHREGRERSHLETGDFLIGFLEAIAHLDRQPHRQIGLATASETL